jgi:hypothetical protein
MEAANPLTTPEFFARNDDLAKRYPSASDTAKTTILSDLYKLDLHLFQAWRILGEDRDDYRQSAVFWLSRALETYKPDKGPFVHWLRFYVQKTFSAHVKDYKAQISLTEAQEDHAESEQDPEIDPVFWKSIKALASDLEWDILKRRFIQGQEVQAIAKDLGTYPEKIRAPLKAVMDRFKASTIKHNQSHEKDSTEARWIGVRELGRLLNFTPYRIYTLTAPKLNPRYSAKIIHPADILRTPNIRIRFLQSERGLIYPRFIYRSRKADNESP